LRWNHVQHDERKDDGLRWNHVTYE
jgi:hypothetical protein